MRNKAAEKAKTSLCGSTSGTHSPSIVTQAGTGGSGGTGGVHSPGPMGQQAQGQQQQAGQHQQQQPMGQQQQQQQQLLGIHGSDISALQRPSYSINGILGIPQPDANANINKRKRDDNGMYLTRIQLTRFPLMYFQLLRFLLTQILSNTVVTCLKIRIIRVLYENANINKRKRDDNGMYLLKSAL